MNSPTAHWLRTQCSDLVSPISCRATMKGRGRNFDQLVVGHPDHPAAPNALLQLARIAFEVEDLQGSKKQVSRLSRKVRFLRLGKQRSHGARTDIRTNRRLSGSYRLLRQHRGELGAVGEGPGQGSRAPHGQAGVRRGGSGSRQGDGTRRGSSPQQSTALHGGTDQLRSGGVRRGDRRAQKNLGAFYF